MPWWPDGNDFLRVRLGKISDVLDNVKPLNIRALKLNTEGLIHQQDKVN
jgi:hypothetical protein